MFKITPAAPADVPMAADILAEAFKGDVVLAAITGRPRPTVAQLTAFFRPLMRTGALRHGRIDLARRTSDGAILGVALSEPPGSVARLLHQAVDLPAFLRALGLKGTLYAARHQATLWSHRPAEPHWYIAAMGVTTQARGIGVGSALLASRLATIDAAGAPVYLESSSERNRKLYVRNGFEKISTITGIPGTRPAGMWRTAVHPRPSCGRPSSISGPTPG